MSHWKIPRELQLRRLIAYGLLAVAIGAGAVPAIEEEEQEEVSIEEVQSPSSEEPGLSDPNSNGKQNAITEPWFVNQKEQEKQAEHADFEELLNDVYESEKEIEKSEEERKKGPVNPVETEQG
jgi:hypothetical protein